MTRLSLRPGPRSGLEIADARGWRVDLSSGGGVVLRTPGHPDEIIARPGQVARVVILRGAAIPRGLRVPARRGYFEDYDQVLAVLSDDAALLMVPLRMVSPGNVASAGEMREASGADDFARGCGLALESATDADAALASLPRSRPIGLTVEAELRRAVRRHWALLAVACIGLVAMIGLDGVAGTVAAVLGTAAVVVLAADQWRYRTRFLRLVNDRPSSPDRVEVPNLARARGPRQLREARLQIGSDDVVHVVGATETWIAGPRLGGTTRCVVARDVVAFVDRRDHVMMMLDAASWTTEKDQSVLVDACQRHGIEVKRVRGPLATASGGTLDLAQATTGPVHSPGGHPAADGDIVMMGPFVTSIVALVIAAGHLFPLEDLDAFRATIALLAALASGVSAVAQLRYRRWARRQTSPQGA